MPEFKTCKAYCWLIVSESEGVYYSANSYNGDIPKGSWRPEDYRYDLTNKARKLIAKKVEEQHFVELEPTDYPTWITTAGPVKAGRGRPKNSYSCCHQPVGMPHAVDCALFPAPIPSEKQGRVISMATHPGKALDAIIKAKKQGRKIRIVSK